ncbi:MAG: hypothetical protein WC756_15275 [Taibaiella sp.]|jgi:hypothetical protein
MESSPFKDLPQGTLFYVLIVAGIIGAIFLFVFILYLKNLQDLLKNVREPNRKMAPAMVWLLLVNLLSLFLAIPELTGNTLPAWGTTAITIAEYAVMVFALVFTFYMVNKISESVAAELASRNMSAEGKPTYGIGMFMCACNTLALVAGLPYLSGIGTVASIAGFVAWIMYWVKTNEYKIKLQSLPANDQFDF